MSQNTPDYAKLKIVVLEFNGYALSWWQQQEFRAERNRRYRIDSWVGLKEAMRDRFIPKEYKRTTYQKLQKLYQGSLSVDDYFKEMERLMTRAEVLESDEATMARFISGLHKEYSDVIDLQRELSLIDAYDMAIKLESQAKRKGKMSMSSSRPGSKFSEWKKSESESKKPFVDPRKNSGVPMGKGPMTPGAPPIKVGSTGVKSEGG
ncbi:retrotransposon gag family protein, partial [Xanthomonas translucens]|uniref:retrotransposon gag family protein n=1 Tax=Xanthomonas campestris pv. translucens TaxID=343 RepID=UPI0035EC0AB8